MIKGNESSNLLQITIEDRYNTNPRDISIASARGCYSKRIISSEECTSWSRSDDLLIDLYKAGHTTTLEHWHLTLNIENISRHFVWKYLHSFPFYSSDQQSQRYVEMNIENFYIPDSIKDEDKIKWRKFYDLVFKDYELLTNKLINIFDSSNEKSPILNKQQEKIKNKKSMEFARYVLPLGQLTKLKYTLNFITIIRMIAYLSNLSKNDECYIEAIEFSQQLTNILVKIEPSLDNIINEAINEYSDVVKYKNNYSIDYNKRFKFFFSPNGVKNKSSNILSNNFNLLKDNNIHKNNNFKYLPLIQNINDMEDFVVEHLVSHSCDSQNQRHRTTKGFRPELSEYYNNLNIKYYTPLIYKENKELLDIYINTINKIYNFFEDNRQKYGFGIAIYLLPNAQLVYFIEKNFISQFQHKAQKRLCYNSQEEIFNMTKDILFDLEKEGIDLHSYDLIAPCQVNKKYGIKPLCPEGSRFCGVKVWNLKLSEMNRLI